MTAINYLSVFDKTRVFQTYKAMVKDMSKSQLETIVLLILNGTDIEYAFDLAAPNPN